MRKYSIGYVTGGRRTAHHVDVGEDDGLGHSPVHGAEVRGAEGRTVEGVLRGRGREVVLWRGEGPGPRGLERPHGRGP